MSRLEESGNFENAINNSNSSKKLNQNDQNILTRKILDEKKSKMKLNKLVINNYQVINPRKSEQCLLDESLENYSDTEINNQLDYIFESKNNLKREYEKNKKNNSCKCASTRCSKFSCNCLRNGVSCDFLCGCKNCDNTKGKGLKFNISMQQ